MENNKARNPSIDIFRYICATLVIAIHTGPLKEINQTLGFIATDVIPRVSVPFFFIISGYFYIDKLQAGKKPFWRYFKHLILIYFVWSCLYFIIDYVQWGYKDLKAFTFNCLKAFVYYGSSYHFWFFPALIFALCATTLLWRFGARKIIIPLGSILYLVGVLGCAYYNICKNVPALGQFYMHPQFTNIRRIVLMGFPYFVGGYLGLKINDKLSKKMSLYLWIVSFLVWIAEIIVVVLLQYQQSVVLTFGLYPLVLFTLVILLQNPLSGLSGIADDCRKLANFTYYTHPAFIMLIYFIGEGIASEIMTLSNTSVFLLTVLITSVIGLAFCRLNKPILNKIIT